MLTRTARTFGHTRIIAVLAPLLLALLLSTALASCGLSAVAKGAGTPSELQCNEATTGHGVDVVNIKVTCQASGAAAGDTSFALHYSVKGSNGQLRALDATCGGPLVNGTGSCSQTYALVIPFDSTTGSISGEFLPSHKPLGPMPLSLNK